MNPLAQELNAALDGTVAGALLSELGRRIFFPKGIVAQSAEAKKSARRANATVGIATRKGTPVFLPAIRSLVPALEPDEIFPYAPTQGVEKLREAWKKEILRKNPDIGGAQFSLPLVVPGLTAGISTLADLFADKGDTLVLPDLLLGQLSPHFRDPPRDLHRRPSRCTPLRAASTRKASRAALRAGLPEREGHPPPQLPEQSDGIFPHRRRGRRRRCGHR